MINKLLSKINNIIPLTFEEQQQVSSYWKVKKIEKNDFLLINGAICKYDCYVIEGSFKAYQINEHTGNEDIIFFAVEDWWATDIGSFANHSPSSMNIQALEDAIVLQLDKISFEKMLAEVPKMERYFRIILQNNTTALQRRLLSFNSTNAEQRFKELSNNIPYYINEFLNSCC